MGLRGPGAVALGRRKKADQVDNIHSAATPKPWEDLALPLWRRVVLFCESLPVTSGPLAGTLWRARPWQKRFIQAVYKTDRRGRRIVRTAVLSMARKNGKSDLASRLCLAHMVGPCSEPRGECYSAANDRQQAGRLFAEMVAIIERVPWMRERISVRRHSKELEDIGDGGTGTVYAALSSDVAVAHGKSVSFFCYDEYGQSTDSSLFDALDTGMGGRDQPFGLVISTQAANDAAPLSLMIDYGLRIERGEIADPSYHLTLYTASPELDPFSIESWKQANPALGDFRDLNDVKRMAAQAQRMPSKLASFENLVLNRRVDVTQQFITAPVWAACGAPVDIAGLAGRPCYAGLDLSESRDLTALVLTFHGNDGMVDVLPFCWLPGDDLREREDMDRAPYRQWRDAGHLLTMPGKTIDPRVIAAKLAELHATYRIRAVGFDRWKIAGLQRELADIGCDVPLIPHGQGYRDMSGAVGALERVLYEERIRHGNHPVLTSCIANARATSDPAGGKKLDKAKSHGRIDAAVALCMALHMPTMAPPPKKESVYRTRGLITISI